MHAMYQTSLVCPVCLFTQGWLCITHAQHLNAMLARMKYLNIHQLTHGWLYDRVWKKS